MKTLMILVAILCAMAFVLASVPQQINYQGSLTRPEGSPLDTTVNITFKLWSALSAGTQLWSETHSSVQVAGGLFNVQLGQTTALADSILNHSQLWLGITVGGDAEMTPRTQIASVGYAYRVGSIDGALAGQVSGDLFLTGRAALGPNSISGANSFAAGIFNFATGDQSSISGGEVNFATGTGSHIGGGFYNKARGDYSTVGGGGGLTTADSNAALGNQSFVGGGHANHALSDFSTISGGESNAASNVDAVIGGGNQNTISGLGAFIGGGFSNNAAGSYSAIPGGYNNGSGGYASFASGQDCHVNADHSFAFCDASNSLSINVNNSFNALATGGVRFWTTFDLSTGARLAAGGSSWLTVSDSTKKRNLRTVDGKEILEKLSRMPIKQWSYKSQDPSIEHVGPTAQDFWNQFHLGDDSLTISTIDPSGIALAAIQELKKENSKLEDRNATLEQDVRSLRAAVQSLQASVSQSQVLTNNSIK